MNPLSQKRPYTYTVGERDKMVKAYPLLVEALREVLQAHAGDKLDIRKDFSKLNVRACAAKVLYELGEG